MPEFMVGELYSEPISGAESMSIHEVYKRLPKPGESTEKTKAGKKVKTNEPKSGRRDSRSLSKSPKRHHRSSARILQGMQKRQEERGAKHELSYLEQMKDKRVSLHQVDVRRFTKPPSTSGWKGGIIASSQFQIFMGLAIALNAIVIGIETDTPDSRLWNFVELVFLSVFLGELLLRLDVFGPRIYFHRNNPDIMWNLFDAGIVTSGVVDTVGQWCHLIGSQSRGAATLLRVFRLLRVVRIFRIIRFLKQLYMLVYGFGIAALATVWVTILALVMLYVCAIIAVRLCRAVPSSDVDYDLLQTRFNKVGPSMVTLFELMLEPDISPFENLLGRYILLTCFLVGFVIFGSFGMLALLTGVISEAMFDKNLLRQEEDRAERELRREKLNRVCGEIFEELLVTQGSQPGRNLIEISMATALQQRHRMVELFAKKGFHFTMFDLEDVFKHIDTDSSGCISQPEFVTGIASISDGLQASTILELHQVISNSSILVQKRVNRIRDLLNDRAVKFEKSMALVRRRCAKLEKALDKNLELFPADLVRSPTTNGGLGSIPSQPKAEPKAEAEFVNSRLASKVDALEAMAREMHEHLNVMLTWLRRIQPKNLAPGVAAPRPRNLLDSWERSDFWAPDSARGPQKTGVNTWLDDSHDLLLVPNPEHL